MKAIITGTTGFLGSHLAMHLLAQGHQVVGMKRETSSLELFNSVKDHYLNGQVDELKLKFGAQPVSLNIEKLAENLEKNFQWVNADLLDTDSLFDVFNSPFDVIFHCAALVSFKKKDSDKMIENNVEGTANLVNVCLKTNQKNLVHISSVAALSRQEGSDMISIDSDWVDSPYNTDYAKSKYFSELEAWRGKEEGLNVAVINPGIIMGVGAGNTAQQQFINIIQSGNPFVPAGSNGFIWVDDLCQLAIQNFVNQNFGKRILGVTHNITYEHLFQTIADFLGKKRPNWLIKGFTYKTLYAITYLTDKLRIPFPISNDLVVSTSRKSHYGL
jgi:nucleoside-diphosphate-sugar epimerase